MHISVKQQYFLFLNKYDYWKLIAYIDINRT